MNGQTHLRQIVKRTGEIAPFSPEKIEQAIFKAMRASGVPNRTKVGSITMAQVEEIAKTKMPDLNAASLEAAVKTIMGTARSMGVDVK